MDKAKREKLRETLNRIDWNTSGMSHVIADEDVLSLIDHIDALELAIKELAAPDYSDEEVFALNRFHNGDRWAAIQLHRFAKRAKAAIAAAPEPQS